jgi:hypothetical protein
MMMTAIIFALSIVLLACYTVIMSRSLRLRFEASTTTEDNDIDEELVLDIAEYKLNTQKLGLLTIAIGVCFALSFFIR